MKLRAKVKADDLSPINVRSDADFTSFQINHLLREIEFLQAQQRLLNEIRSSGSSRPIGFLRLQLLQFYWTVTRLGGLSFLHDGESRPPRAVAFLRLSVVKCRRFIAKLCGITKQDDVYVGEKRLWELNYDSPPKPSRPQLTDHVQLSNGPRVLIDVTVTHRNDCRTGIQRVVREVTKASISEANALPVIIDDGRLLSYFRHPQIPDVIEIRPDDRILLLDANWCIPQESLAILEEAMRCGAHVVANFYDIIPLLYPGVFGSEVRKVFGDWLEMSLPYYSAVVTISRSVAEDFCRYVAMKNLKHRPSLGLGWYRLGADFAADGEHAVSQHVFHLCQTGAFFLTVGTLEPRKNHMTILTAFERLWDDGLDVRCVIVGKRGWLAEALYDRLLRHAEFGHRLFWIEECHDTDLHHLYKHATALIQASIAEGFGLPIIEAAHFGTPVIASDIPVFREVGGQSLLYFPPTDPESLADCLRKAMTSPHVVPNIEALSWKEATERLLRVVKDETYEFTLV